MSGNNQLMSALLLRIEQDIYSGNLLGAIYPYPIYPYLFTNLPPWNTSATPKVKHNSMRQHVWNKNFQ